MSVRENHIEIDRAAALWASRIDRGLNSGEATALEAWKAADTRRNGALARALAVMDQLDRAQALGTNYDPQAFRPPANINRRAALWGGGALAASVAAAIGVGLSTRPAYYVARKGQVRLISLADGSVVTLNSASKVAVRYSEGARDVTLLEGEALFDVAKNPDRPFTVYSGDARVRAVGTSFTVRRLADRPTQVVVREGVVEVSRPAARTRMGGKPQNPTAVRLVANEMATADAASTAVETVALSPVDLQQQLAWKDGMIAFKRTRLSDAAAEFARYSDTPILVDPAVADRTITGLFSAYNPAEFAQSAALSLDLTAQRDGAAVRLTP